MRHYAHIRGADVRGTTFSLGGGVVGVSGEADNGVDVVIAPSVDDLGVLADMVGDTDAHVKTTAGIE